MVGRHWKNLPQDPACSGPTLEHEVVGFCSPGGAVGSCQDSGRTCAAEQEEATGLSSKCGVVQQ